MQQIADWLQKLGLGQYAQRFAENEIDAIAAFVVAWLNREHKAALSAIERALTFNPLSATALIRALRLLVPAVTSPSRLPTPIARCA